MSSRLEWCAEAACRRGRLGSYATAACRISFPRRGCFCGRSLTRKRPIPCDPHPSIAPRRRLGGPLSEKGRRSAGSSGQAGETPALPVVRTDRPRKTIGSGARHLALLGRGSALTREVGGEHHGGQAPSSRSPPGADRSSPRAGEDARLPGDQIPFKLADGGVLGLGGRPSFSVFNEPCCPLPCPPPLRGRGSHPPPQEWSRCDRRRNDAGIPPDCDVEAECHKILYVSIVESLLTFRSKSVTLYLVAAEVRSVTPQLPWQWARRGINWLS